MLGTFLIGRCARGAGAATLFCVALLVADAAHAARHGASHAKRAAAHAATPALDAQAIDNAQFSAPSGKGRARAPSAATIVKEEILLDRADFSPGEMMAWPAATIKRRSPPSSRQTGSSLPAASMRKPGIA
jgi:hypothetical protein